MTKNENLSLNITANMINVGKYKNFYKRAREDSAIFQNAKNEFKNRERKDENHLSCPYAWDIARLKIKRLLAP